MDEKEKKLQELYRRAIFIPIGPQLEEPKRLRARSRRRKRRKRTRIRTGGAGSRP